MISFLFLYFKNNVYFTFFSTSIEEGTWAPSSSYDKHRQHRKGKKALYT